MPRRVAIPALAACVIVLLWVTVPPDILRFLLRTPIVLSRDLISIIRRAFAPAPRPVPTGSPFADIPGSEAESGIGPASTPTGAAPAGVQPSSTGAPTDASPQTSSPAPGVTSPQDSPEGSDLEDPSPSPETPELLEVDVSPVEEVVEDLENIVEETLPGVSAPEVPEAELPGDLSEVEPPEVEPSELPGVNELPDPGDLPNPGDLPDLTEPLPDVEVPALP